MHKQAEVGEDGGGGVGVYWMGRRGGKAKMPVISADHDTPLEIRNQRTEGRLLEM